MCASFMSLISSMRRTRGIAIARRSDHETLECTVAVRHRADEHFRSGILRDRSHKVVSSEHLSRVKHADAIGAVRTMKYHRPSKQAAGALLRFDIFTRRRREAPRAKLARVRTGPRLDAIDRTDPLREAHVVRTILCRALPGCVGR